MNSTTVGIVTIASGIVIGASALYAINKGLDFNTVLAKFEEKKEVFHTLVENLLELGRELLTRIYNTIMELVKEFIFKFKIKASYY